MKLNLYFIVKISIIKMHTATAGSSFQPSYALYVENLHPDVTDIRLFEKFLSIGPVHSVRVCRDMITRRSLGYGYVSFCQPRDGKGSVYRVSNNRISYNTSITIWPHLLRDSTHVQILCFNSLAGFGNKGF